MSTPSLFLTKKPTRIADLKIVLLGESSVGKSSILQRLQSNTFNEDKVSTIGAAFISKKILREDGNDIVSLINMQIWDTAGQERFHNLTPLYYRNSNLAIIVFDLSNESTFEKAEYWINELKMYMGEQENLKKLGIVLVGNKLDLLGLNNINNSNQNDQSELTVDSFNDCSFDDKIQNFLNSNKQNILKYFKISAKKNIEISELFNYIIDNVDPELFYEYQDEEDINKKNKKGLIDLRFGSNDTNNGFYNSCQC